MIIQYLAVAFVWGFTAPFIKAGSDGLSANPDLLSKLLHLARWQYLLPLAINLSGSSVYYYLLAESDLTVAVPIINGLSLVMTLIAGWVMGEKRLEKLDLVGISLVGSGVFLLS